MTEPHHTARDLLPGRLRRFAPLLAAIGVGVALFGYLSGVREPESPKKPPPAPRPARHSFPDAVRYSELPAGTIHPKYEQSLSQLYFDKPGIFDPVTRTDSMKLAALADRARNRAYDGAPPTIPHPVDTRSAAACLACHGEGLKVGDRIASRISHTTLSNCTQCHVEQSPLVNSQENDFVGVYRAGPGPRANPGAPPGIPHHTFMRENCASCHGLVTRAGTRTTHPWLSSCTQCHAPSAALDQVDFGNLKP